MTPKEYLSQYRNLDIEIDSLVLERERLYSLATTRGGSVIDGTPKGAKSDNAAPYERIIDRIIDIDDKVNKRIDRLIAIRHEINAAINGVKDDKLRSILRLRYINGYTFEQIAVELDISYRHICRLHGKALREVEIHV